MNKKLVISLILLGLLIFINSLCYAEFRDPFKSYLRKEKSAPATETKKNKSGSEAQSQEKSEQNLKKELTAADVKTMVPFKLLGIMNSGNKRRALLDTGGNTTIIKSEYNQNDFQLVAIDKDRILIRYQQFYIIMKVGGDIVEIKK